MKLLDLSKNPYFTPNPEGASGVALWVHIWLKQRKGYSGICVNDFHLFYDKQLNLTNIRRIITIKVKLL